MAVDIKNLIAAISPEYFCDRTVDEATNKPLHKKVMEIVKEKGYLAAAEAAKLRASEYMDIMDINFSHGAFKLKGLANPIEQHRLVYEVASQSLEQIYFWILDYVNGVYGSSEKLIDNFISAPGSGHFAEMQGRATRMQEEAMKIFQTTGVLIKSILNIIYDLKEWQIRLALYDDLKSDDKRKRNAARLSLKQIWMDNVDIKRGNSSIKAMAQQFDYVTLIDAFMAADSLEEVEKLDLNDRVKRILLQRVADFLKWVIESERESRKRFEIEKIYLRSQVNNVKLYAQWAKPYLKAAQQLGQNLKPTADVVNLFNTSVSELVLLAKGRYDMMQDVAAGELPALYKKLKIRKYTPLALIEFRYRSIPERADQRGGYVFVGLIEVIFTSFALNDDELKVLTSEVAKDDFGDIYQMISGATDESLMQIQSDIDELLGTAGEKKEETAEKMKEDTNPFSALFSGFGGGQKKEEKRDLSKGIPADTDYEKPVRNLVVLKSRRDCGKLYDDYKKAHGMAGFPPVQF